MNKLLFLDFDGVLHPTHFAGQDPFNRVHLLEETLEGSNIGIVISSSWRFTHSLEKLQKELEVADQVSDDKQKQQRTAGGHQKLPAQRRFEQSTNGAH